MTASALQPAAKTLQPRHRSVMRRVVDPARTMARIRARIAETAPEDARLRVLLVLAHEVLRLREQESAAERLHADASDPAPWTPPIPGASKQEYAGLIPRIRELVGTLLPSGSNVLVTSRGDDALLELAGVRGAHFPQENAAPGPVSTRQIVSRRSLTSRRYGLRVRSSSSFRQRLTGGSTTTASSRVTC